MQPHRASIGRTSHHRIYRERKTMRLSFGLEARQVQVQKLAPRMIQSMEILQLPMMALQERIEQEMSDNPVLEIQDLEPNATTETADQIGRAHV